MTNKVSGFVEDFMARVEDRNPHEPEFLQAVREVVSSLVVVLQKHPEYQKSRILERMVDQLVSNVHSIRRRATAPIGLNNHSLVCL